PCPGRSGRATKSWSRSTGNSRQRQEDRPVARTLPSHSVKEGAPHVFHNNDACSAAIRIEPVNWRGGAAGRLPCKECAGLNAREERSNARPPSPLTRNPWARLL